VGGDRADLNPINDKRETKDDRGIGSFLFWTFLVAVTYILSTGPAAWISRKFDNSQATSFLGTIYAPAASLLLDTPLRPFGVWYLGKWIDLYPVI